MDRRDVGMVERGQESRLALETRQAIRAAREALGQDFERHVALERRVARAEHLAHAARAQLRQDAIDADAAAQCQRHRAPRLPQPTLDLVARAGCLVGGRRGSTSGAAARAIMRTRTNGTTGWRSPRAVRDPGPARRRRHGRGVPRPRHAARARRRAQGDLPQARRGCLAPAAVRAGGARGVGSQPPLDRHGLRRR